MTYRCDCSQCNEEPKGCECCQDAPAFENGLCEACLDQYTADNAIDAEAGPENDNGMPSVDVL
jgi:hypothetical protein